MKTYAIISGWVIVLLSYNRCLAQDVTTYRYSLTDPDKEEIKSGSSVSNKSLGILAMEVYFDNDILFGRSDEDYTTGLRLRTTLEAFRFNVPFLFGFADYDGRHSSKREQLKPQKIFNFQTLEIGLNYFTPTKIDTQVVMYNQRPYASNQYVQIGRESIRKRYSSSFQNESVYEKLGTRILIGLTGGPAAASLQRGMHRLLTNLGSDYSPEPEGWKNQIGGERNLLIINYNLEYEALIAGTLIRTKKSNLRSLIDGSENPYNVYKTYQDFNYLFQSSMNVGNLLNTLQVGFRFNFLNINRHNQYYLKYFEDNQQIYPHNNSSYLLDIKKKCFCDEPGDSDWDTYANYSKMILEKYPSYKQDTINELMKNQQSLIERFSLTDLISVQRELVSRQSRSNTQNENESKEMEALMLLSDLSDKQFRSLRNMLLAPNKYFLIDYDFHVFLTIHGTFVGHNGNIQGPLFANTSDDYTIRYINPIIGNASLGFEYRRGSTALRFSANLRTREIPSQCNQENIFVLEQCEPNFFIDLKKYHMWGNISIVHYPGMLLHGNERRKFRRGLKHLKDVKEKYNKATLGASPMEERKKLWTCFWKIYGRVCTFLGEIYSSLNF